jgi:hypothetical protein
LKSNDSVYISKLDTLYNLNDTLIISFPLNFSWNRFVSNVSFTKNLDTQTTIVLINGDYNSKNHENDKIKAINSFEKYVIEKIK